MRNERAPQVNTPLSHLLTPAEHTGNLLTVSHHHSHETMQSIMPLNIRCRTVMAGKKSALAFAGRGTEDRIQWSRALAVPPSSWASSSLHLSLPPLCSPGTAGVPYDTFATCSISVGQEYAIYSTPERLQLCILAAYASLLCLLMCSILPGEEPQDFPPGCMHMLVTRLQQ